MDLTLNVLDLIKIFHLHREILSSLESALDLLGDALISSKVRIIVGDDDKVSLAIIPQSIS